MRRTDAPNNSEFEFRIDEGSKSFELYGRMVPRGRLDNFVRNKVELPKAAPQG